FTTIAIALAMLVCVALLLIWFFATDLGLAVRRRRQGSQPDNSGEHPQTGHQSLRVAAVRDYFEQLRRAGAVREIAREVSGKHELAAVTQASQRESEAPLLFHRVTGSRFPVITNVFGSRARLMDMIGARDGSFCRRWAEVIGKAAPPPQITNMGLDLEEIRLT